MAHYSSSLDDNDPTIDYSGGWNLITSDGNWHGTMHATNNFGSTARIRFTGSRVAVICTIPAGRGDQSVAQFSLDGHGRFYLVSHPTSREVRRRIVFWDSGPLPFGQHVLTIMNMGREAEFRLNRIDFDPTDGNAAQAPNPPSQQRPQSTEAPLPSFTTETVSVTQTLQFDSPEAASSSIALPPGAVTTSHTIIGTASPLSGSTGALRTMNPSLSTTSTFRGAAGPTATDSDDFVAANSKGRGESIAGILAGTLGGILGVVIIVTAVLLLRRRRRIRRVNSARQLFSLHDDDQDEPSASYGARKTYQHTNGLAGNGSLMRTVEQPQHGVQQYSPYANLAPQSTADVAYPTSPTLSYTESRHPRSSLDDGDFGGSDYQSTYRTLSYYNGPTRPTSEAYSGVFLSGNQPRKS